MRDSDTDAFISSDLFIFFLFLLVWGTVQCSEIAHLFYWPVNEKINKRERQGNNCYDLCNFLFNHICLVDALWLWSLLTICKRLANFKLCLLLLVFVCCWIWFFFYFIRERVPLLCTNDDLNGMVFIQHSLKWPLLKNWAWAWNEIKKKTNNKKKRLAVEFVPSVTCSGWNAFVSKNVHNSCYLIFNVQGRLYLFFVKEIYSIHLSCKHIHSYRYT